MKPENTVQVHRFRDYVALYTQVRGPSTVYLTPSFAIDLAENLIAFAHDIERVRFSDSLLSTAHITTKKDDGES